MENYQLGNIKKSANSYSSICKNKMTVCCVMGDAIMDTDYILVGWFTSTDSLDYPSAARWQHVYSSKFPGEVMLPGENRLLVDGMVKCSPLTSNLEDILVPRLFQVFACTPACSPGQNSHARR